MAMSGPTRSHHGDEDDLGAPGFSEINITPLTDIFLVLLIIFMVGSSVTVTQAQAGGGAGVRVDLPKGAAKELNAQLRDFPVAVLKDGTLVVDGKSIDLEGLQAKFLTMAKANPDAQVIIQADMGVNHGRVVEVMEAAKKVGISRLAIATDSQ
jgi:biopolymer transport protein ExbD